MENFSILTNLLLGIVVGWAISKIIIGYLNAKNAILEEEIADLTQKIKERVVRVTVERHGDVYYLYEKETDNFVAQGRDADEIKEILLKRWPNKTFFADEENVKSTGLSL
jgi:hypothetical protein